MTEVPRTESPSASPASRPETTTLKEPSRGLAARWRPSIDRPDRRLGQGRWPSMRVRAISILVATLLYPVVLWGAVQAWNQGGTRVEDWLPPAFEETRELMRFGDRFGSEELLMIGWETARLGDPELERLRELLLLPDPEDSQRRTFFAEVLTGDSVERQLTDEPARLTKVQAHKRMAGWILGKEGETAILALVSKEGIGDRRAAVAFARRAAETATGLPPERIHLAGPTIEGVVIDETSKSALLMLNGYSFLACWLVLVFSLRSLWYSLVIFVIALYCQQATMALIHYSGGRLDSILLLTANLAGVLSISAAIHMHGYFRDARGDGRGDAASRAFRRACWPTTLAALTTAVGFGSLAISRIAPVHHFGLYSAIAAPIAALVTLWYLAMYLPSSSAGPRSGETSGAFSEESSPDPTRPLPRFERVLRLWPWTFALTLLVIAASAAGATRLKTSVGLHELFPSDSKLLRDYGWLEEKIGPLIPVEAVLELPVDPDRRITDELTWVAGLQATLNQCDGVGATLSCLNFSPPLPRPKERLSAREAATRAALESRLRQSLDRFERIRMLHRSGGEHHWRVTARVHGSIPHDFPRLADQMKEAGERFLETASIPEAKLTIAGGVPVAARTQQRLLSDLGISFLTALILISITTSVVLRSLAAGLMSLVPNVLPALLVFGTMGWLGWKAELGAVLTASAVLGIAIDDSLHLIIAFRRHAGEGASRQEATLAAIRQCRGAMIQTSLVCGLGMLVFALSPFVPIARFGCLMFVLLAVALLADLLLLPSILYSPCGELFRRGSTPQPAPQSGPSGI